MHSKLTANMPSPITISPPRKAFLSLEYSSKMRVVRQFEEVITLMSGDNNECFLDFVLQKTKLGKNLLVPISTKALIDPMMRRISALYDATPQDKKSNILSLVAPDHTLQTLVSYGFDISASQLYRARKIEKNKKATLKGYKRIMPLKNRKTTMEEKEKILEVLLKNSTISSYTLQKIIKYNFKNKEFKEESIYTLNHKKNDFFLYIERNIQKVYQELPSINIFLKIL